MPTICMRANLLPRSSPDSIPHSDHVHHHTTAHPCLAAAWGVLWHSNLHWNLSPILPDYYNAFRDSGD
jgi:hypothetical protein